LHHKKDQNFGANYQTKSHMTNYVGELHHVENEKIVKKLHVKICNDQIAYENNFKIATKNKALLCYSCHYIPEHIEARNFPMKLTL